MEIYDLFAIIGFAISSIVFLTFAFEGARHGLSIEERLFAGRQASGRQFGPSFAAASTSLSTVLIFFISTSNYYGALLFWCGLTYFCGQYLFIRYMRNVNIDTEKLTTNSDFWLKKTNGTITARVISFLTVTAFALILFLEIYIGSEILGYFLGFSAASKAVSFIILGLIVIGYVRLGGIEIVFRTDFWQLLLMCVASIGLLAFATTLAVEFQLSAHEDISALDLVQTIWGSLTTVNAGLWPSVTFIAWILILNLTLPFTQLSSWQRLAATKNVAEAWSGLRSSSLPFFIVWWLPVAALLLFNGHDIVPNSLSDLFDILRDRSDSLTYVLFPLIFVGFASALFSTADTAMIALQLSISDKSMFGDRLREMGQESQRRAYLIFTASTVICLGVIYYLAEADLGAWFIPLVYAIFSQLTLIAPHILYAIATNQGPNIHVSKLVDIVNALCLLSGWSILIAATVLRSLGYLPQAYTQEIATFVALIVSALGLLMIPNNNSQR